MILSRPRLPHAFRALRHRNFQIFWAGQGLSVIGTWLQLTAQGWLLYRLTSSPFMLGLLTMFRFMPSLVIAPLAGLVADRFPRRQVVILTQGASLVLASILAALTLSGRIRVPHILVLGLLQGAVDSVDMTVRQTLQMDLVGPQDLQSAVSLNSAAFNSARMVGPLVAGVLISRLGEGPCFALNALSYLAVLLSLLLIRVPLLTAPPDPEPILDAIREGMAHVWNAPALRRVMAAVALTSAAGLSMGSLMPALARDVLHTGPQGFGRLLAGSGIGAIVGAVAAAATSSARRAPLVNPLMLCAMGVALTALGLTRSLVPAVLAMTAVGTCASIQLTTSNAFLQMASPPSLRGRIVSLYVWIFQGATPLGGFAAGLAAQHAGIPSAIWGSGLLCLLVGLVLGLTLPRPFLAPPPS